MESTRSRAAAFFGAVGRAVCYLLAFIVTQAIATGLYLLAATLYIRFNPGSFQSPDDLVYACADQISILSGLFLLILLFAFFLLRRKNPLKESGILATRGRFVFTAIAITPLLYAAILYLMSFLPEAWTSGYAEAASVYHQTDVIMMVAVVLIAPIVEEIVFRGLILSRLRRALPGWLSVVITALLFGACHAQIAWMLYAFVLGLFFGFVDLKAKSIWPSLCAHLLFNGIGQLAVYLPETDPATNLFYLGLLGAGAMMCVAVFLFRLICPLKRRTAAAT